MFCPEKIVYDSYNNPFMITRYEGADYHQGAPWRIRLNPLRYQFCLRYKFFGGKRNYYLNKGAWLHRSLSNLWFRVRYGDPDKYFKKYRKP